VSVQGSSVTLRYFGGWFSPLHAGTVVLKLLGGPRARLRHRYTGEPVLGSVLVEIGSAVDGQAPLPSPEIKTWGVLGQPCQVSSGAQGAREGQITVTLDDSVAWSGLLWELLSAPPSASSLTRYLDEVNGRTVSGFAWTKGKTQFCCYHRCLSASAFSRMRLRMLNHAGSARKDGSLGSRDA